MSALLTTGLLGLAGLSLVLVAVGARLAFRRRTITPVAVVLMVAGVGGLAAGELTPRLRAAGATVGPCTGVTGEVGLAGAPVAWQLVTGGVAAEVLVPRTAVRDLVNERLDGTPLAGAQVNTAGGTIRVTGELTTPVGPLPVEVEMVPQIRDGALSASPGTVTVAGRRLPSGILDRAGLGQVSGEPGGSPACEPGDGVELTGVRVEEAGVVVEARLS